MQQLVRHPQRAENRQMKKEFLIPDPVAKSKNLGFTLIELMIVVAIIAVILTLALPVYSNFSIRAKVGEALSLAAAAKTATASVCQEDPHIAALSNTRAGYSFQGSSYVELIEISGPCVRPVVTIRTRNTGAGISPVLVLTGDATGPATFTWACTTALGQNIYVPSTCRS
jgi:type IV pilus assembly protein PilA